MKKLMVALFLFSKHPEKPMMVRAMDLFWLIMMNSGMS